MKLERDGVTICGFVIIFILILLILLPPFLRLMFGNEKLGDDTTKVKVEDKYENLSCNKEEQTTSYTLTKTISTVYKNNEINKLTFKYIVTPIKTTTSQTNLNITIPEYEILKQVPKARAIHNNNEYSVVIEYDKTDQITSEILSKYIKSSNEQKAYYTNEGYVCNIIK